MSSLIASIPASTIDPVDRLVARFYRNGYSVPPEQYRTWALKQLAQVIPHDGALWGSGTASRMKFNTVSVIGLPPEFPRALEETTKVNPMLPRILQNLDTPVDMASVWPDEKFYASELYRRAFEPFGVERILSTAHMDRRSGLFSLVTIYRKSREARFSDVERAAQKRLTFHLFNAASHAFFLHLMKSDPARPHGATGAVVDAEGAFHEAQPRFLDLLDERFPERRASALPFRLPEPGTTTPLKDLMVRCEKLEDLFNLTIWPAGPLDRLTAREREIVTCVAQGLSFKQAAKKIGVAPSTVANHLYRVYRKLGVYSRTELAQLVYPAA
ncbi:MAG TPA: LuxR C-terminal-related transcriptional regulator [Solimonas sp.]|nr:LuxR C-terminal-related transcriptional regulator [Solimonas sp.]